ncbi:Aspartate/prephenate aminotransferase [Rhodovastum atsumiense]|uniref:Aminotransferase n=1 Tax=Rhodovastum atsumiense TaxID=504468 RepID=A0A5M6IQ86_9PROT|nr:pyridoxal phosphate-dependent aminotransferase [Rhodovastum atsumiense]KAA5610077.1 pyridoxal phosphate-dependent aminotransferase [Rhodovastum atsumiense]CAH2601453.1 Aspartate/prephenate aminotransferase [Rhodovastum atsumiense]
MPALAQRLGRAQVAATVAMTNKARALREAGHDVVSLTIGEPDFATPPHVIAAAHAAALAGDTKYPPQDGTRALKDAVCRQFRRDHGLEFGLDEVMISNGAKQVIYNALAATVDEGDEVVIPVPSWVAYSLTTRLIGGEPVHVTCPQNNGFRLRPEDLDAAITPRTRWLILNFPNNPTGAVPSRAELAALAEVMLRHPHVWIMSDDMYAHLYYGDEPYVTLAEIEPRLRARTLTVGGVSKTYAMTGWRIGYAGGPRDLIRAMVTVQGHVAAGVSTIGQAAAVAALDGPQELVAERAAVYRRRRDFVVDALNACPGLSCHRPEGAFYVFPNVAGCLGRTTAGGRLLQTDEDFALALLDEQHVALVHGAAFGMSPYLRISYATDDATLARAMERIAAFTHGLR